MFYSFWLSFKLVISLLLGCLAYGVYVATLFTLFIVEWKTFPIVNHTVHLWYGDSLITALLVLGYALVVLVVILVIGFGVIGNIIGVIAKSLIAEVPRVIEEVTD